MKRLTGAYLGRETPRGQTIVLVAVMMVVMIALAGLAIDVSAGYLSSRFQSAVADAASLAGAPDLQQPNTRSVTTADPIDARTHALDLLVKELRATSTPTCPQDGLGNYVTCSLPGTPYDVSIKTPSPSCVTCDPNRSVQVTVRRGNFGLFFARVFGFDHWTVSSTSVAGINNGIRYALITLRPPNPNRNNTNDPYNDDVNVNGNNTRVNVQNGDVGSNTTAVTNSASFIVLDSGFHIYHLNPPILWNQDAFGEPAGITRQTLIQDPSYLTDAQLVAIKATLTTWANQDAGEDVGCTNKAILAPGAVVPAGAKCYKPGLYPKNGPGAFSVGPGKIAYLYPGVYYFTGNVQVSGTLIGGSVSKPSSGVAVIVQKDVKFSNQAGSTLSLNMGPTGCSSETCRAAPAAVPGGSIILETADGSTITLVVERWLGCFSGTTPRVCTDTNNDNTNKSVDLSGGGYIEIAGIIYAPSDQVKVASSVAAQNGTIGQIISWTVTYTGNTTLNQRGIRRDTPGVLRLDAACTQGEVCNSP